MKSPPKQLPDDIARTQLEDLHRGLDAASTPKPRVGGLVRAAAPPVCVASRRLVGSEWTWISDDELAGLSTSSATARERRADRRDGSAAVGTARRSVRCRSARSLGRRAAAGRVPARRRAERPHLGHRDRRPRSARAGRRPSRARPLGLARGRRLRPAAWPPRHCGRCCANWAPNARLVVGMSLGGLTALRLARLRAGAGARAGPRRRHAVGAGTPRADDQGAAWAPSRWCRATGRSPASPAMLDVTIAAAPHRDRKSLRRGVFHNSQAARRRHLDVALRLVPQCPTASRACGTTCPPSPCRRRWCAARTRSSSTTRTPRHSRTSAPGFQRTHVVADSGHSVQGDQPAALVDILRGVLGA